MGPSKKPMPTPEKVAEPVRVPQVTDPDVQIAKQRAMLEEEQNRRGRSSTSLSGGDGAYARTTLG